MWEGETGCHNVVPVTASHTLSWLIETRRRKLILYIRTNRVVHVHILVSVYLSHTVCLLVLLVAWQPNVESSLRGKGFPFKASKPDLLTCFSLTPLGVTIL